MIAAVVPEGPGCTECGHWRWPGLYVRINEKMSLCRQCYDRLGRPSCAPSPPDHIMEEAIRQRMLRRKGYDAVAVRAGRT